MTTNYFVDGFTSAEASTDGTVITAAIASAGSVFAATGNFATSNTPLTEWFVNTVELGPLNGAQAVVAGTPFTDSGGTRSWRHNLTVQEYIFLTFTPAPTTHVWSIGFYFKTDLANVNPGQLYDIIMVETSTLGNACIFQLVDGNPIKFQLETSSSIGTKHFPVAGGIAILANHVYWGTVQYNSVAGLGTIACYDPAANWKLIGKGSAPVATDDTGFQRFRFGGAQHGIFPNSNVWYDCMMYDVSTGRFPLGFGGAKAVNRPIQLGGGSDGNIIIGPDVVVSV
jgi:hypothetical protein